jgi:hypothetical protein
MNLSDTVLVHSEKSGRADVSYLYSQYVGVNLPVLVPVGDLLLPGVTQNVR